MIWTVARRRPSRFRGQSQFIWPGKQRRSLAQRLGINDGSPSEPSFPVASDSDEAQALYTRARELSRNMKYRSALELAERAVGIDAGFVEARLLVAELYQRLGAETHAIEVVREAQAQARSLGIPDDSTTGIRISAQVADLGGDRSASEVAYALLVAPISG